MSPQEPILKAAADLIFSAWQEDGRFRVYPTGGIYPCQTAIAANVLCHMGYAEDERLQKNLKHLLDIRYQDGGWRCNKFSFGHGEETEYSNPQPTLNALDAFRFSQYLNNEPALDRAVEFLLEHWIIRKPIGPCHYGIGTLFMQVEYPFRNYNLFPFEQEKAGSKEYFSYCLFLLRAYCIDRSLQYIPSFTASSACVPFSIRRPLSITMI